MTTIEAKFYNRGVKVSSWKWITIHCTQSQEIERSARGVARWFEKPWNPRKKVWVKASAHCVFDNREAIQCVPFDRIAYHARGLNNHSLGLEFVGSANQTREQWLDEYSRSVFDVAVPHLVYLANRYGIQMDDEIVAVGILKGSGGVTTHAAVTKAFMVPGGHTDPGAHFPMDYLLSAAHGLQVKSD